MCGARGQFLQCFCFGILPVTGAHFLVKVERSSMLRMNLLQREHNFFFSKLC